MSSNNKATTTYTYSNPYGSTVTTSSTTARVPTPSGYVAIQSVGTPASSSSGGGGGGGGAGIVSPVTTLESGGSATSAVTAVYSGSKKTGATLTDSKYNVGGTPSTGLRTYYNPYLANVPYYTPQPVLTVSGETRGVLVSQGVAEKMISSRGQPYYESFTPQPVSLRSDARYYFTPEHKMMTTVGFASPSVTPGSARTYKFYDSTLNTIKGGPTNKYFLPLTRDFLGKVKTRVIERVRDPERRQKVLEALPGYPWIKFEGKGKIYVSQDVLLFGGTMATMKPLPGRGIMKGFNEEDLLGKTYFKRQEADLFLKTDLVKAAEYTYGEQPYFSVKKANVVPYEFKRVAWETPTVTVLQGKNTNIVSIGETQYRTIRKGNMILNEISNIGEGESKINVIKNDKIIRTFRQSTGEPVPLFETKKISSELNEMKFGLDDNDRILAGTSPEGLKRLKTETFITQGIGIETKGLKPKITIQDIMTEQVDVSTTRPRFDITLKPDEFTFAYGKSEYELVSYSPQTEPLTIVRKGALTKGYNVLTVSAPPEFQTVQSSQYERLINIKFEKNPKTYDFSKPKSDLYGDVSWVKPLSPPKTSRLNPGKTFSQGGRSDILSNNQILKQLETYDPYGFSGDRLRPNIIETDVVTKTKVFTQPSKLIEMPKFSFSQFGQGSFVEKIFVNPLVSKGAHSYASVNLGNKLLNTSPVFKPVVESRIESKIMSEIELKPIAYKQVELVRGTSNPKSKIQSTKPKCKALKPNFLLVFCF